MRGILMAALVLVAATGAPDPVRAADPGDPDWPCVQRKVAHLSIGVLWPHPIPGDEAALPSGLDSVADRLALRRVSEEDAARLLAEVGAQHAGLGLDGYGRLFQATFAHIDRQRSEIIAGISRYARNQSALAREIEELQAEMTRLETAEPPDFDRIDALEAELDWRIRVFRDRDRALTYVCESPVLLEQRAYRLAQLMLAAAEG